MNKIEKLISDLCRGGVKFQSLGDVCSFKRGAYIARKDAREGDVPVIHGGENPSYFHDTPNRKGETIAVAGSGSAGYVSYWNKPVWLGDSFSIEPNLNILLSKFVFYFLKNKQEYIYTKRKGAGVPHVYIKDLTKISIPTPP